MNRKKLLTSDDVLNSPGTYFNPETEVTVTVDDTNYVDITNVNLELYTGKEWIRVNEDPLNDQSAIEETLQNVIQLEGGPQGTNNLSQTAEDQQEPPQDPPREQ